MVMKVIDTKIEILCPLTEMRRDRGTYIEVDKTFIRHFYLLHLLTRAHSGAEHTSVSVLASMLGGVVAHGQIVQCSY
jgi:hypothetical protein